MASLSVIRKAVDLTRVTKGTERNPPLCVRSVLLTIDFLPWCEEFKLPRKGTEGTKLESLLCIL